MKSGWHLFLLMMAAIILSPRSATAADFPVLERKDCAKDPRVTGKCRWVYGEFALGANGLCYLTDFATKKMLATPYGPDAKRSKGPGEGYYCLMPPPVKLGNPLDLALQGRFLFCPMANYHDFLGWDRWDEAGCIARIEDANVFRFRGNLTNPPLEFLLMESDNCPRNVVRGEPCEGP